MPAVDRIIPKTMSSQHPDNVSNPPWLDKPLIAGDDEVDEVFNSWTRLGCQEAMWDAEGKDVDLNVVRKLLAKYGETFPRQDDRQGLFSHIQDTKPLR
ncbi:MAG: phosphoenolpyruvate carboxylase [Candidatus Caldarchaeum sp.]